MLVHKVLKIRPLKCWLRNYVELLVDREYLEKKYQCSNFSTVGVILRGGGDIGCLLY